ncbi:hypothetical protein D7Y27_24980 [Corallococcus sp. AB004]|nr:hypothetical protein [Corallococcus exiguus]NRD47916.1 hypothetical protein [Corallococcus exiguus]RKI05405.1 hypothetical protein D7Y04_00060 [Corallococcus sp. AB038B]RKI37756.1 hypothetical protein D7Y27_24980 [Corallococcus sp. AB004]
MGRQPPHLPRPGRSAAAPRTAVWDTRDRRDLAFLGLWVLVYGLAVAPVLHAVVGHGGGLGRHEHGVSTHVHRTQAACDATRAACPTESEQGTPEGAKQGHGHQHLTGSVEHLLALAASWTVFVPPKLRWVSWRVEPERSPKWSPGQRLRSAAMPQGP